jgi:hypothetical protein
MELRWESLLIRGSSVRSRDGSPQNSVGISGTSDGLFVHWFWLCRHVVLITVLLGVCDRVLSGGTTANKALDGRSLMLRREVRVA